MRDDPHLQVRGFFREVAHPLLGTMRLTAPVWRFDGLDSDLLAAPLFGEHNAYLLEERLGYTIEEIRLLEQSGVISSEPRP